MKPTVFLIAVTMTTQDRNGNNTVKTEMSEITAIDTKHEAFRLGAEKMLNEIIDRLTANK